MAIYFGGAADDFLFGDHRHDNHERVREGFHAGRGNDIVHAYGGKNRGHLHDGDDLYIGGDGQDEVHGDAGSDRIKTGGGNDIIWAQGRPDDPDSQAKAGDRDVVFPGEGRDLIYANNAPDEGQATVVINGFNPDNDHVLVEELRALEVTRVAWSRYDEDSFWFHRYVAESDHLRLVINMQRPNEHVPFSGYDVLVHDEPIPSDAPQLDPGYQNLVTPWIV